MRKHDDRVCRCATHVQLSYYLKAFQLWRKAEHVKRPGKPPCECTCKVCRNNHALGRAQLSDCSSFGEAVHHGEFCGKDTERGCRPLRCALGHCPDCHEYDDAIHVCPKEFASQRLVRYKTKEPVSCGGKVFDDWVYKECRIQPFLLMIKKFYQDKYRLSFCS